MRNLLSRQGTRNTARVIFLWRGKHLD